MRSTCSAVAVLLVAYLVAAPPADAAGLVFSDDFESGNLGKWSKEGTHDMCTVVQRAMDGGMPHSGQNMMQCNWNGTVAWNDPQRYSTVELPQSAWRYQSEFLIRLWLRYDNDVTHNPGNKVLRLYPNERRGGQIVSDFFMNAQMEAPGGPALFAWNAINGKQGPTFWGGRDTPLGDHNWHKVEIYMKASPQADGVARVWIDGKLRQEVTNLATIAEGYHNWGPLCLMSNWASNPGWEHGPNNHVYWDDVEIYTDTGSGALGQMSDASIKAGAAAAGAGGPGAAVPTPPGDVKVH